MNRDVAKTLEGLGIQPSAQRMAVAEYILNTEEHPCADQVLATVSSSFPFISRATVYNTLNLFVEKGLIRGLHLSEGKVVFDANLDKHHHLIDESTGRIHDIAWDKVQVCEVKEIEGFDILDYQVVLRGIIKRP